MMNGYVVLDSGILIARTFSEQYTPHAIRLLHDLDARATKIVAPYLMIYELVAVVRKLVHLGRVTPERGATGLVWLLNMPIELRFDHDLHIRAYDLAVELNRVRAYDTQFLALAERLQRDFWTTDEKFYNIAHGRYPAVRWIGTYPV